ncbi:TIGR03667 family PPOX class F420-dependent oxidoreductase [Dictyobacter aurantiacus]|uniref:Pyridoxamine 5'-phosphate oxidase n=1 Tax=Dictyobacter aurantiacus TaxID=1936993 RepID=A0A401ZCG0_9CHLR|nr:TIGR03667 family PPOX class F420-dependent oxidoreductase [Dictyobacter aurantiacus]GCE04503.1 pyridoxamine 5'-phosphate oxidase [Dictyobacter aurantiacus]
MALDLTQAKDAHVDQRLKQELMMWLNSVRANGRPHTVPVWFLWHNNQVFIFSQPGKQKIRNVERNPYVTLSLDTRDGGGDIVIIEGEARLEQQQDAAMLQAYASKYAEQIKSMGWTFENMSKEYSQLISVTPTKFISWND